MKPIDSLVLGTVNAPYSKKLDAAGLVACILDPDESKAAAGPMSSFFYEISPALQMQFAEAHSIPTAALRAAAAAFDTWSGQKNHLLVA
ncbi:hypothetical protein [Rhizobium wuzhouense]|uniref:Uncharacterized protein n=1 Tax=Rhizobium wuzhouense TaxID=1986026 RepID=A0ABX5NP84_9HYPH|nr:hypothetical protein [Rhizobium wuzhouense]PYB69691.1 hypothetical protein DMY87_23435 [Rhizobium wuzhouense]